ncbi:MAG: heterodisulfide reductase-related iron-sulfur binding cluster [Candidatus Promineifilaceae bacterium]|nr:heterodisulfide reductase-related iron-sulfur binding cluster [Candidatus Promineifilaceae bacterium]
MAGSEQDAMTVRSDLAQRIQQELGQNVYLCYQCVKCTSGCPVGDFFDWQPNQVMRAVQLGQEDVALQSQTPWLCAACQTCSTRCPQGLDINAIMEYLTREAVARGVEPPVPEVNVFNQAFMREVRLWGRAYEPGLMAEMKLRNPARLLDDMDLYVKMLRKRKVAFMPKLGRPPSKVKPVPEANKSVAYYPGCSLHSTATEFDRSARAVCESLDIRLVEPKGWQCCGSSAAHRVDPQAAVDLPLQNLSLIERSGFQEVTMPCAACFNRHKAAQFEIRQHPAEKARVDDKLDQSYEDTVAVTTLSEMILNHVGPERVAERVRHPLKGLRVVAYYGCLLTRPPQVTDAPHPENPTDMDELMAAAGAEVVDWSYKTVCCGAAHSLTRPDIVLKLSGNLIDHAREAGADAIVVACPLCHTNLDARQFQMDVDAPMPVFYFTQLMALALGLPEREAALNKNLTDPRPLLRDKGLLA